MGMPADRIMMELRSSRGATVMHEVPRDQNEVMWRTTVFYLTDFNKISEETPWTFIGFGR